MPTVAFPGKGPLSPRGGRALLWIGLAVAVGAAALVIALIGGATTKTLFGELDRVSGYVNERGEASRPSEPSPAPPVQPATPAPPATPPEGVTPERLPVLMSEPEDEVLLGAAGAGAEEEQLTDIGAAGAPSVPEEELPPPALVVTCGAATCAEGLVCCNESCGICAAPGETCDQHACGMPSLPASLPCGINTCNVGDVCCNPSCGICTPPGGTCDTRPCSNPIQYPGTSQMCGMQTCNVGLVCCNPSCGICAEPGEPCSHEVCD